LYKYTSGFVSGDYLQIQKSLLHVLSALTSQEESCRKKLIEKKKVLDELMLGIKCSHSEVKLAALQLFASLSRSDKMIKAIILEHAEF